ncbi:hypothetical protein QTP88_001229 [Uroleucon formosanum]
MVHNGLTNLFNEMKYEINSTEVQRVKKPGITSAMKGYCSYSPADSNIMQNAAWDISGKNANFVKNNTFSGCIPLKQVFGFCDDYKRILVNCSQQLILNRSMLDLSSLHFTSVPGGDLAIESVQALVKKVKVQLTRVLWKVPVVKVDDHEYIDEPNSTQTSSNSEIILNPSTSSFDQSFVFDSHTPAPSTIIEELSSKIINKQTKMTQFTLNKTSKMKIDNALAYFITTSMAPYNVVEKEGFKLFVNALNPTNYLPFTTDCWTSSSNKPFIAMTCHFNTNFKLDVACLGCIELSEDHTGDNISDVLQMFILDYEIPDWKICSITTDHGSNMLKAVNNLSIPHVDCFGHVLNIEVSVILNLDSVKDVVNKLESCKGMEIVQERFSLQKKKKFPSYSKTRWWSILELINVIIDQDLGLASFLHAYKNGNYTNLIFQEADVIILKNYKLFLQPIREITDNLAGDSYVTGSAILPIVFLLTMDLNRSLIQNMYSAIINVLDRRYINNTTLMICSTLDPRFKIEFIAHDDLSELKTKIVELCEINLKKSKNDETFDRSYRSQQAGQKKRKTGLSAIFGVPAVENVQEIAITLKMKIESELNLYLTIPKCNFEQEPLEWWNMNKDTYPMLSLLAEKSLTVQASSVSSERVFSKGGCILTDLRSSLSNEHASQLIYLSMNKDYVPKPIFLNKHFILLFMILQYSVILFYYL